MYHLYFPLNIKNALKKIFQAPIKKVKKKEEELEEEEPEKEELDWWSKYYASLAELEKQVISFFFSKLFYRRGFLLSLVFLYF